MVHQVNIIIISVMLVFLDFYQLCVSIYCFSTLRLKKVVYIQRFIEHKRNVWFNVLIVEMFIVLSLLFSAVLLQMLYMITNPNGHEQCPRVQL